MSEYIDSLLRVGVKAFIWELTAANQRVSNAVFSFSSPFLVLRFCIVMFLDARCRGHGKAANVVKFVAKWLNLCPATVLS